MRHISYYYGDREGGRMSVSAQHEPGPSLVNGAAACQPAGESLPRTRTWPARSLSPARLWSRGQSLARASISPPLRSSAAGVRLARGRVRRGDAPRASAAYVEQRRRMLAAALLVYALAQANLGLAWDIRWHGAVGRDDFWTAPHILIYSGVALAGLLCLGM